MKTKIYLLSSVLMAMSLASCNDDDNYVIATDPIMNENSVVTGSSDVTATSATLNATVQGIEKLSPAGYKAGFKWGYTEAMTENVNGTLVDGVMTATIDGLKTNSTIYYQAYVTLSGQVTFSGEVKTLVTTNCTVSTADAAAVDFAGAKVGGTATEAPASSTFGVVIATKEDQEAVRGGLIVPAGNDATFSMDMAGLAPSTTYYYAAYADLGTGVVYGPVKSFKTSALDINVDDELVDLGLSVKWAKRNVGARTEGELGGLFGYGDLSGVNNSYAPEDYASADIYKSGSDMANQAWAGKVTLPTAADFEELFRLCSSEWTEENGVAGYKLTGPNGNSIFLPAAGSRTINDLSGRGTVGMYATGSINASNKQFNVAYQFGSAGNSRTSTPVYQALSVRPVSTARNVVPDMSILYQTWEIDYNNGETVKWNGPVWFYGTDDCWATVTNGEPLVGDSWCWDADKTNTWAFGDCTGYVTFNEDGTIVVKNQNGEEQTGTYTVDLSKMTITSTVDLLVPDNFPSMVNNRKNEIKILSLTDAGMQLGYFRDSDPATLSVNMIPQLIKYGFPVNLLCVGADLNDGTWGQEVDVLDATSLEGKHTFKYEGAVNGAKVFTIDIAGLRAAYPNAIVTINEMRCDGEAIKFDGAKFRYGDIEEKGNFRVEVFNVWGKASNNGQVDSPFSENLIADSDPNFNFSSSFEVDYTVALEPTFIPTLITIAPSWKGSWDYNEGATLSVVVNKETGMYEVTPATMSINLPASATDANYEDGSIMTFIQISDFMNLFPGTQSVLDELKLDGQAVTGYDASKVVNTNDGAAYRLELWNCYGYTGGNGCAFGERDGDTIHELAFSNSMEVKFTVKSLFSPVEW
ncbi:MAG: hypothetical protein K2M04_03750 [Muribaculaceae bacterium]|nr:hypothetical protein [Muribaculaceae bacterium]